MENNKSIYDVWLCADLHIRHKNILKHQPNRIKQLNLQNIETVEEHDEKIIQMWLDMTKRGDHIYVLGDFIMSNQQDSMKILHRLKSNGCHIHLIVGNHDKSTRKMYNMFESIDLIKNVLFKKSIFPFLDEDFRVIMCHYPMISWEGKPRGSVCCYAHIHDNALNLDNYPDLRFNVGLDHPRMNMKLANLKDVYSWYKEKLNGMTFNEYIDNASKNNEFIR